MEFKIGYSVRPKEINNQNLVIFEEWDTSGETPVLVDVLPTSDECTGYGFNYYGGECYVLADSTEFLPNEEILIAGKNNTTGFRCDDSIIAGVENTLTQRASNDLIVGNNNNIALGVSNSALIGTLGEATADNSIVLSGNTPDAGSDRLGEELITNGDFSERGGENVENGAFSELGAEQVENGSNTDVGADWNVNTNWSKSVEGRFSADGSSHNDINQGTTLAVVSKIYEVTYEILTIAPGGGFKISFGGVSGTTQTTVGVHTEYISATSTDRVRINPVANTIGPTISTIGSVTGISIREIYPDGHWRVSSQGGVTSASLSLYNGACKITKTSNDDWRSSFLNQLITYTSGKHYEVKFSLKNGNTTGANIYIRSEYSSSSQTIASGITLTDEFIDYTYSFTADSSSLGIAIGNVTWQNAGSGEYYYIDNVSIKEVGQGWTIGAGWSILDGYAESDGTTSNLDKSVLTIGKTYRAIVDVSNITAGTLSYRLGGSSSDEIVNISSDGTYTNDGIAGGSVLRLRSQSGFNGKVTNISIKEVFNYVVKKQNIQLMYGVQTTTGSTVDSYLNGLTGSYFNIPDNSVMYFHADILAVRVGGTGTGSTGDFLSWVERGVIINKSGVLSIERERDTIVGHGNHTNWRPTAAISGTDFKISVRGAADTTIEWASTITFTEIKTGVAL